MAGLLRFFGIQGTSDGTPTGTPSVAKIVSGVVSVVAATSDATLTTISNTLTSILTQVTAAVRGTASYKSAAAEACASVKATAGYLNSGMVYNAGGDAAYVQFHDLAAAPIAGAVPALVVGKVASGDTVQWPACVPGTVGLQVCLSSTKDTYTAYAFGHFFFWRD